MEIRYWDGPKRFPLLKEMILYINPKHSIFD